MQVSLTIAFGTPFSSLCGASNPALGITIVPINGVGDGACYIESNLTGTVESDLVFEKAGQAYTILANLTPTATAEAAEKTLAIDAAARL